MPHIHTMNQPDSPAKGLQRRRRLLFFLMLGVLAWAGVTAFEQMGQLHAKAADLANLKSQQAQVQQVNNDTKQELTRMSDSEYRAEKMRKDLQVAKPGETVFQLPSNNP